MILDMGPNRLRPDAMSGEPHTLMDAEARRDLAGIVEIDMIENGDPAARRRWQERQLANLLGHAASRSAFWRQRLAPRRGLPQGLAALPVLTRGELSAQAAREGSLMPEVTPQLTHASSGSTGTPVTIHVLPQNGRYNGLRSLAQMLMEHRDLSLNRAQVQSLGGRQILAGKAIEVERQATWLGSLGRVFQSGRARSIAYAFDRADRLAEELAREPVGYLVCAGGHMDNLLGLGGVGLLKELGVRHWVQLSDAKDEERCRLLQENGITTLANYSSAEVGMIGSECAKAPFHYHVAHSNVIVETDRTRPVETDGRTLYPILVTHLHSYATPVIRYDSGDLGTLLAACPCGHRGPTLTNVSGRRKTFLRHPDGRLVRFYVAARTFRDVVDFEEISFRQVAAAEVLLQMKRRNPLTAEEDERLRRLLAHWIGPAFTVVIRVVSEIDWKGNSKRLLFINELE